MLIVSFYIQYNIHWTFCKSVHREECLQPLVQALGAYINLSTSFHNNKFLFSETCSLKPGGRSMNTTTIHSEKLDLRSSRYADHSRTVDFVRTALIILSLTIRGNSSSKSTPCFCTYPFTMNWYMSIEPSALSLLFEIHLVPMTILFCQFH